MNNLPKTLDGFQDGGVNVGFAPGTQWIDVLGALDLDVEFLAHDSPISLCHCSKILLIPLATSTIASLSLRLVYNKIKCNKTTCDVGLARIFFLF